MSYLLKKKPFVSIWLSWRARWRVERRFDTVVGSAGHHHEGSGRTLTIQPGIRQDGRGDSSSYQTTTGSRRSSSSTVTGLPIALPIVAVTMNHRRDGVLPMVSDSVVIAVLRDGNEETQSLKLEEVRDFGDRKRRKIE